MSAAEFKEVSTSLKNRRCGGAGRSKRFATSRPGLEVAKPLECADCPRFMPPFPATQPCDFKMFELRINPGICFCTIPCNYSGLRGQREALRG